jgi:hypothetical protein
VVTLCGISVDDDAVSFYIAEAAQLAEESAPGSATTRFSEQACWNGGMKKSNSGNRTLL